MNLNQSFSPDLPRLKPIFLPREMVAAHNSTLLGEQQGQSCFNCLDKLNLPTLAIPRINILRITFGSYGFLVNSESKLAVGGMEMELMELDRALIKSYPVNIRVLSRAFHKHTNTGCTIEPESLGNVDFNSVPNFGRFRQITLETLKHVLDANKFDLIHMHYIHVKRPSFDALFQEAKLRNIPIIATNHTCDNPKKIETSLKQKLISFKKYISELIAEYGISKAFKLRYNEWRERKKPSTDIKEKLAYALQFRSPTFQNSPFVAVSKYSQEQFQGNPSIVIGSAIDVDYFQKALVTLDEKTAIQQKLNLPKDKRIITYHARIAEGKGQLSLVEVAKELRTVHGEDFHFAIIGTIQDPKYLNLITNQLSALGLSNFFTIHPALDMQGIRSLLSISSAFVFPTRFEALGRSAIEAMLMEVPVVANNVGGIPEYVKNQETGLLVELDDTKQMADALKRLFSDSALRATIVNNADAFCRRQYCSHQLAKDYIELVYGPVVANRLGHY